MLLPLRSRRRLDRRCVCVSFAPHMNAVIWRCGGRVAHGVSGPTHERLLRARRPSSPCPACATRTAGCSRIAMSTCGQSSSNHARPPLPATMWTRARGRGSAAANATPLPAVLSRISKILLRETPSAAPAATLHLMRARRVSSCFSSRLEVLDLAMVGLLTRRCRPRPAGPRRQGAYRCRVVALATVRLQSSTCAGWRRHADQAGDAVGAAGVAVEQHARGRRRSGSAPASASRR